MITFDATLDFEAPGLLELALTHSEPSETLTVVVRHDSEIGEIYRDDDTIEAPIHEDDWCVTGPDVSDVAAQLRALL